MSDTEARPRRRRLLRTRPKGPIFQVAGRSGNICNDGDGISYEADDAEATTPSSGGFQLFGSSSSSFDWGWV